MQTQFFTPQPQHHQVLWQNPQAVWTQPAPVPWAHVTLDIETSDGSPEEAELVVMSTWRPASLTEPGAWKDDTAGRKLKEAMEKRKQKLALLDSAPVLVVSLRASDGQLLVLHCMEPQVLRQEPAAGNGCSIGFSTEKDMLIALRALFAQWCNAETVIQGFNILEFDLPKLRNACLRNRLHMPAMLSKEQPVFDAAKAFRHFTVDSREKNGFVPLTTVLQKFGLATHKDIMSGAEVPLKFKEGAFQEIITYAMLDVVKEDKLCALMRGTSDELT